MVACELKMFIFAHFVHMKYEAIFLYIWDEVLEMMP